MATKTNNAEGATTGTALTTSNQGASGDVLTVTKTGSGAVEATASTPWVIHGTKSYLCTAPASSTAFLWWAESPALTGVGVRAYFHLEAVPAAEVTLVTVYNGGNQATVNMRTTGRIALVDAAGTSVWVSPVGEPLSFPCTIAVDLAAAPGSSTTTGTAKLNVYDMATSPSAARWSSGEVTGNFYRSGVIDSVRLGALGNPQCTVSVDSIARNDSYGFVGPVSAAVSNVRIAGISAEVVAGASGPVTVTPPAAAAIAASTTDTITVEVGPPSSTVAAAVTAPVVTVTSSDGSMTLAVPAAAADAFATAPTLTLAITIPVPAAAAIAAMTIPGTPGITVPTIRAPGLVLVTGAGAADIDTTGHAMLGLET